jgi:hypothetical protein
MTALAADTLVSTERWSYRQFTLQAGQIAYKGGTALLKTADGKVYTAVSGAGYSRLLGIFAEHKDASSAGPLGSVDQPVNVDLLKERTLLWRANDGTITAANVGSNCYVSDDQTVSINSTNQSLAGVILAVSTVYGVAFEVENLV